MAIIGIILSILGALPKLISLVMEIIRIIKELKKNPAYTFGERLEDEDELKAGVAEFKAKHDATRLQKLLDRVRARRMRANASA